MKIFDCVPFFDEKMLFNLRLNILKDKVYKFVVVEQSYTHSGERKKQNFNIEDYPDFKDRIIYFFLEDEPKNLHPIDEQNPEHVGLKRMNSIQRINIQYNKLKDGLVEANPDDLIIVSDCDEIPNLNNLDFNKIGNNFVLFKQLIFYYKFNLLHENHDWFGSKACKMNKLTDVQSLKYIKNKKYPFWRVDTFFSKNKFTNIKIIDEGGWHFTNIKNNKEIFYKLMNYGEYNEFERSGLSEDDIQKLIDEKKLYFNHDADKTSGNKYSSQIELKVTQDKTLPKYLIDNKNLYQDWFA